MSKDLRKKLIRLAHAKPHLRPHLIPILKGASKRLTSYREMGEAIRSLGKGDKVTLWVKEQSKPWVGEVIKPLSRDGWYVKGKGGVFRLEAAKGMTWFTPAKNKYVKDALEAMQVETYYQPDAGYDQRTGKFKRGGVMYFDLTTQEYQIEEDVNEAEGGDEEAIERLNDAGFGFPPDYSHGLKLSQQGYQEAQRLLGVRLNNEGHSDESLVCKFGVASWSDVQRIYSILGDEPYYLDTPYMEIQGLTLYPDENLVNGRSYGVEGNDGDLDDWLEDFKPGGTPGPKR